MLVLPLSNAKSLEPFVEKCLRDQILLICVVGDNCQEVEDQIDWLIVGDGSDEGRFITTTSHPDETLSDVIEFAEAWYEDRKSEASVVKL
ncbi:hypothetical protein MNBD_ALPHA08-2505 [hydrothermal vent metagenome]|uniref:Uncharacterized protein n=1 Tax=hydrothermal vent metagenome TaxID=652676 RepID=A0A3B0R4B0_9ZZZZ